MQQAKGLGKEERRKILEQSSSIEECLRLGALGGVGGTQERGSMKPDSRLDIVKHPQELGQSHGVIGLQDSSFIPNGDSVQFIHL